MADFEGVLNFENLDPADFGEPTAETRARLTEVTDSLKQLTMGATFEPMAVLAGQEPDPSLGVTLDDLCPLTQYNYNQSLDPLFGVNDEAYLQFELLDGDPDKFGNWAKILGNCPLVYLYYQDSEVDISYSKSFESEEIYITEPISKETSIFSDEFQGVILQKIKNHMQAYSNGAVTPTEGTMKKLAAILEQEVAKRITAS